MQERNETLPEALMSSLGRTDGCSGWGTQHTGSVWSESKTVPFSASHFQTNIFPGEM